MSTEKRIVSGVFVGFISFALGFVQAILLVPILLTYWGNEIYGFWLVLNAGYIILQTLDSGHQQFIGNEFNIIFFSAKKELKSVLASSLRIASVIGLVQLIVVFILVITSSIHFFLGLDAVTVQLQLLNVCLIVLIIGWISSGTFTAIILKLLIPYGYYSKMIWWGIYKQFGSFFVLIIIAINRGSLLTATIGITIFTLLINLLFLYRIKVLLPDLFPWWRDGNLKVGWKNFKNSSLLSLSTVIYQFSSNGLILLITNLFGAIVVPLFTTIRTLTNSITSMTNILIQPLQPDIVKFRVQNEFKKITDTFDINWLISGAIINVGALIVLPFIIDIYEIWTRGKIEFNFPLFLLLTWSVSIVNFGTAFIVYINSMNKLKLNFLIVITKLVLIFGGSIFLSSYFGIISIGMAIAIAESITFFLIPFLLIRHEFKLNGFNLLTKEIIIKILPTILLGIIFLVIYYDKELMIPCSLLGLFMMISIYIFQWLRLSSDLRFRIKSLMSINNNAGSE